MRRNVFVLDLTSAPILSFPSTTPIVDSINTYGTNNATSTSGVSALIDAAMALPSANASSLVDGFNFQLPLMKGLRASSLVDERECCGAVMEGEKAVAVARREARRSFMVLMLWLEKK
jgi:hypothetical protein